MKKNIPIVLIMILLAGTFSHPMQDQKRRIPDYNNRDSWQQPDKILDVIGIKPGMIVADVGAGRGYFTFRLAERVGPEGKVFANEIDKERLLVIENRIQKDNIKNIVTILGEEADPKLPKEKMDVILMVHVFQIVYEYPYHLLFLENLRSCLKADGLLVLVEWDFSKLGLKQDSRQYTEKQFKSIMEDTGFEIIRKETFLEYDNIYLLRKK